MKENKALPAVLAIGLALLFLFVLLKSDSNSIESTDLFFQEENTSSLEVSAWIPWWDEERVLTSLDQSEDMLTTVLPVWYQLKKDGTLEFTASAKREVVREAIKKKGLFVIPTIGNEFDPERVSILLHDEEKQQDFFDDLIEEALIPGYDGWDLDWEYLDEGDKDAYSLFIQKLATVLHREGLLLSVTVHAQTGTSSDWKIAQTHDYTKIGEYADMVRIMVYDFHHAESSPGAITPLDKLEEVLSFAVQNLPREKIIIGLPTYGYDWEEKGESVQFIDAIQRLSTLDGSWERDEVSWELTGTYMKDNLTHTLWFLDSASIEKKIEKVLDSGVSRVCFWRIGGEDPTIWSMLQTLR